MITEEEVLSAQKHWSDGLIKISNNHKKYAITWFSMAISILLIYLYFRKKNY